MLIAQNKGAGANIGGPDVCMVPPGIPVPFINFAFNALAVAFCPNILLSFIPALKKIPEVGTEDSCTGNSV